jgi:hypothetical protein
MVVAALADLVPDPLTRWRRSGTVAAAAVGGDALLT